MNKATTAELRIANRKNILDYIYHKKKTTKQDIAAQLQLSLPTVSQCLKDLELAGIIEKNGYFESTGGRKANAISFIANSKIAIGLELLAYGFEITAINLYGDILKSLKKTLEFANTDTYYQQVCTDVNNFIASLHISAKRILGVGIVLQGLISSDGTRVTYGKILGCTGLTIDTFTEHIPYPCSMIHDAEAAAIDELWCYPNTQNAFFFHMRSNLSGAIIIDGNFLKGLELKSGVFEHMTIVPGGRHCYCGKQGCVDAYCSLNTLLEGYPNADLYFEKLRSGDSSADRRWKEYLKYLSIAIDNLHMFIDSDVILGGVLARYINKDDITHLYQIIAKGTAFPTNRKFIKISRCANTPIAKGAALPYVKNHLATVGT